MHAMPPLLVLIPLLAAGPVQAQDAVPTSPPPAQGAVPEPEAVAGGDDLAAKVANPVADLISVPFQTNIDCCFGPRDARRFTLNIQPVVPVSLGSNAQVVVRTILPFVSQDSPAPGVAGATDFGDITQSFFFKPKHQGSLTLAAGPVMLWPVGGSGFGSGKWGAGPTVLALKQTKTGLAIGLLANHIWSYAGKKDRQDVSNTFIQPFFSKTFKDTTSITINTETSYDWKHEQWTVPLNLSLGRLMKIGKQPVQLAGTARYYAERPEDGPTWGARLTLSFLFPK